MFIPSWYSNSIKILLHQLVTFAPRNLHRESRYQRPVIFVSGVNENIYYTLLTLIRVAHHPRKANVVFLRTISPICRLFSPLKWCPFSFDTTVWLKNKNVNWVQFVRDGSNHQEKNAQSVHVFLNWLYILQSCLSWVFEIKWSFFSIKGHSFSWFQKVLCWEFALGETTQVVSHNCLSLWCCSSLFDMKCLQWHFGTWLSLVIQKCREGGG